MCGKKALFLFLWDSLQRSPTTPTGLRGPNSKVREAEGRHRK